MKIIRAYILTAIACISITSFIACVFIADENAKRITLGQDYAVMVLTSDDEKRHDEAVNAAPILKKIEEGATKAASIAPPPISNLYWIFFT